MDLDFPLAPPPETSNDGSGAKSRIPWGAIVVIFAISTLFAVQWTSAASSCLSTAGTATCGADAIVTTYPGLSLTLLPFLHGSVQHFISNVAMILLLGIAFERRRSSSAFIGLFVLAAYVSIYADISFGVLAGTGGLAIGTSGATRAISGFLVVHYLSTVGSIGEGVPVSHSVDLFAVVVAVVALYATLISLGQYIGLLHVAPETAYVAHLVGTLIGLGSGIVFNLQW